jgi:pimeloyl-ACP methyl ester carboxylesterase
MGQLRFVLLGVFVVITSLSCTSAPPREDNIGPANAPQAIIFVPGYYGSALADAKTRERVFLTFGQAMWGQIPLAIAQPDLGVPGAREFIVEGMLKNISIVPAIYSFDAYGNSLDYFAEQFGKNTRVVSLPYDWRQDIYLAVKALGKKIDELHAEGVTSIAIVAHSFGGILVSYYLRYGTQDFATARENWAGAAHVRAVVLAGVPFRGSMTAFRNIHLGTSLGLAKTPLNVLSLSTFPAMYQLMPNPNLGVFLNGDKQAITDDVYDADLWIKKGWALAKNPETYTPEIRARRLDYQRQYLQRARQLRDLIDAPVSAAMLKNKLPGLNVRGKGFDTLSRVFWSANGLSDDGTWSWDESNEDGDGTVTFASARLPEGLKNGIAFREAEREIHHQGMYADREIQELVTPFLREQGF